MLTRTVIALLTFLAFMPAPSHALSIAVVDMQRVMAEAKSANSARDQLESKQKAFQAQLSKTESDLQKKDQELAKQRGLLAAEEFKNKLKEFRKSAAQAQKDVQQKRLKWRRAFERSIVTIQKEVTSIVAAIAKEKGHELILPSAQALYAKSSLDITNEVIARLDAKLPSLKVDFSK